MDEEQAVPKAALYPLRLLFGEAWLPQFQLADYERNHSMG